MGAIMAAWIVELGLVSYRGFRKKTGVNMGSFSLPPPADYVAVMLLFGSISFASKASADVQKVAALLAWGYVLATVEQMYASDSGLDPASALVAKLGTTSTAGTSAAPAVGQAAASGSSGTSGSAGSGSAGPGGEGGIH